MKPATDARGIALFALCLGCSTAVPSGQITVKAQGLTNRFNLTRVTVQAEPAGLSAELLATATAGLFTGVLDLPEGVQTLTVTAYIGTRQVGQGHAEVTVVSGERADVSVRIVDQTGPGPPAPDPWVMILSVSASKTEVAIGETVELTVTAVDPDGGPITFEWSDNCGGTTFGSPSASSTSWSHSAPGACDITVRATADGVTDSETLRVITTATPAQNGGVSVSGQFIPHPLIERVFLDNPFGRFCQIDRQQSNAVCEGWVNGGALLNVGVRLDGATAADSPSVALSDNCGGASLRDERVSRWQAPRSPGVCLLTATVTNPDGLRDTFSVAVVVATEATGCADDFYEGRFFSAGLGTLDPNRPVVLSSLYANDTDEFGFSTPPGATVTIAASRALSMSIYRVEVDAALPDDTLVASGTGSVSATLAGGTRAYYVSVAPPNPGACDATGYELSFSL